jgi:biopolymer transport protein ExbB
VGAVRRHIQTDGLKFRTDFDPDPQLKLQLKINAEDIVAMAPNNTEVENPFGFVAFLNQADAVAWGTLIILLVMSLASWYIILTKLWDQRRIRKAYLQVEKGFWTAGNLRDGTGKLTGKDNAFKMVAEDGMRAAQHHEGRLTDQIPLHEWITVSLYRSVDSVNSRLQAGLAVLATTGSTAPFVGLFGTVWGIYNALISISLAGQASLDKIAGPIGEALIMTAIGLFVAVPAVMGYNWLLRRNKDINEKLRYFAADLHSYLVSGARVDAGTPATSSPRTSGAPAAAGAAARK